MMPLSPSSSCSERTGDFQFHQNIDIAAHNLGLDNRQQIYRFFSEHFGLPVNEKEIPVGRRYQKLR